MRQDLSYVLMSPLLLKTHWRRRAVGRDLWLSHPMGFEEGERTRGVCNWGHPWGSGYFKTVLNVIELHCSIIVDARDFNDGIKCVKNIFWLRLLVLWFMLRCAILSWQTWHIWMMGYTVKLSHIQCEWIIDCRCTFFSENLSPWINVSAVLEYSS